MATVPMHNNGIVKIFLVNIVAIKNLITADYITIKLCRDLMHENF